MLENISNPPNPLCQGGTNGLRVVLLTLVLMAVIGYEVKSTAPQIKDPIVEFLKDKEGYRSQAYRDAVGVWTIGFGHTGDVSPGQKISRNQGEMLLRKDARRFEKYVWKKANRPLDWYKFGSLVSFCYNLGYRLQGGLLEGIRTGNDAKVTYKIKLYKYAGGRVLRGLVIRRKEEAKFYVGDRDIIRRYTRCR